MVSFQLSVALADVHDENENISATDFLINRNQEQSEKKIIIL